MGRAGTEGAEVTAAEIAEVDIMLPFNVTNKIVGEMPENRVSALFGKALGSRLLARIPGRAVEVLPPTAPALADGRQSVDEFDAIDVFGVLVTDLQFDSKP